MRNVERLIHQPSQRRTGASKPLENEYRAAGLNRDSGCREQPGGMEQRHVAEEIHCAYLRRWRNRSWHSPRTRSSSESMTPLGRPLVPDVYSSVLTSSKGRRAPGAGLDPGVPSSVVFAIGTVLEAESGASKSDPTKSSAGSASAVSASTPRLRAASSGARKPCLHARSRGAGSAYRRSSSPKWRLAHHWPVRTPRSARRQVDLPQRGVLCSSSGGRTRDLRVPDYSGYCAQSSQPDR